MSLKNTRTACLPCCEHRKNRQTHHQDDHLNEIGDRHRPHTAKQVDAFCDALRLFRLAYSWGGPISLVVPYNLAAIRQLDRPHLKPGRVVRLCIGLEAVQDLQQDIAQALAVL